MLCLLRYYVFDMNEQIKDAMDLTVSVIPDIYENIIPFPGSIIPFQTDAKVCGEKNFR